MALSEEEKQECKRVRRILRQDTGPRFFDHAAHGVGHKTQRRESTMGICPSCNKRTAVTRKDWHRACRPACSKCGAYLIPSQQAQDSDKSLVSQIKRPTDNERRCVFCDAVLRAGNPGVFCAAESCTMAYRYILEWYAPKEVREVNVLSYRRDANWVQIIGCVRIARTGWEVLKARFIRNDDEVTFTDELFLSATECGAIARANRRVMGDPAAKRRKENAEQERLAAIERQKQEDHEASVRERLRVARKEKERKQAAEAEAVRAERLSQEASVRDAQALRDARAIHLSHEQAKCMKEDFASNPHAANFYFAVRPTHDRVLMAGMSDAERTKYLSAVRADNHAMDDQFPQWVCAIIMDVMHQHGGELCRDLKCHLYTYTLPFTIADDAGNRRRAMVFRDIENRYREKISVDDEAREWNENHDLHVTATPPFDFSVARDVPRVSR